MTQLNKSDLKKYRKHCKNEQESVADLIINRFRVKVCNPEAEEKQVIMSNASNLIKLMKKRLEQFEINMSVKYGYDYDTYVIDRNSGEIKPRPPVKTGKEWMRL